MAKTGNQAIQEAGNKQKREYEKVMTAYLETFTSEKGKAVLADMRKRYCGSYANKKNDELQFMAGQREVVKDIEALIIASGRPDLIEKMFEPQSFEIFG